MMRKNLSLHISAVILAMLLVYLWSAPKTVMLEDDGLFILAAYFNGISHPPGYPLYTLLGHVMTWMPLGSIAYRVHVLSAIFGALGCGLLWHVVNRILQDKTCAYAASLVFGFSQVYWSQAIVAEVYTLNVFITLLLIVLALDYVKIGEEHSSKIIRCMGLVYGLGLSNHWPLLFLTTPMLLLILWPGRKKLPGQIIQAVPFLLLGLLPYVWLVWRSQLNPEIGFYGPLGSWSDFWYMVSRSGYQEIDQSISAGWWDKGMFSLYVLKESVKQFGLLGAILAGMGFCVQWRLFPPNISLGLLAGYLGNTFLIVMLLGFDYDMFHMALFRVYPINAYFILSIWLATGLYWLINYVKRNRGNRIGQHILRPACVILLVSLTLIPNLRTGYRRLDNWAENYALAVLDNLPVNSVFLVNTDFLVATLGYLNKVEKYREDVRLYQTLGLVFNNRLFRGDGKITETERIRIIKEFVSETEEDVYFYRLPEIEYASEFYGLFSRVIKDENPGRISFIFDEDVYKYYLDVFTGREPSNPWGKMIYRYHKRDFCFLYSGLSNYTGSPGKQLFFKELVNNHCRGFYGYLGLIYQLRLQEAIDWDIAEGYISNATLNINQAVTKQDVAFLYNFHALMLMETGKPAEAGQVLNKSISVWRDPENNAYNLLNRL